MEYFLFKHSTDVFIVNLSVVLNDKDSSTL